MSVFRCLFGTPLLRQLAAVCEGALASTLGKLFEVAVIARMHLPFWRSSFLSVGLIRLQERYAVGPRGPKCSRGVFPWAMPWSQQHWEQEWDQDCRSELRGIAAARPRRFGASYARRRGCHQPDPSLSTTQRVMGRVAGTLSV